MLALMAPTTTSSELLAYVIGPGALSWAGLYLGGFHPALALVPIVPFMPHGTVISGSSSRREETSTTP